MEAPLKGYAFWEALGGPRWVLAPMVEGSDLPYRMLARRYGTQLAYAPMLNAGRFATDPKYRRREFHTAPGDRPLIVQFCANDPDTLLAAARLVEHQCDAVDLNLGCPQNIAKRGHYGAYLQDEWALIRSLISTLDQHLAVPVTAKVRVFPDVRHTVEYARMLQDAGASVITVHGRTRDMRGVTPGMADWSFIRAVKDAVGVPVIANGNILSYADLQPCLDATNADAVMSAEGMLWDPRLFADPVDPLWTARLFHLHGSARKAGVTLAAEYLDLCETFGFNESLVIKAHLFKLLPHGLEAHPDLRAELADHMPPEAPLPFAWDIVRRLGAAEAWEHGQPGRVERRAMATQHARLKPPPLETLDADGLGGLFANDPTDDHSSAFPKSRG
jgi:tRNA-dihydrouridine synthase 1